jgi:hypothetical protein
MGQKNLALNFVPEPGCDRPCLAALTGASILFVYLRPARPYTLPATNFSLIAWRRQELWHGSGDRATFASRPKGHARAAKGHKIEQLTYVFMQRLDSKDKIAMRLQPVERKYSRRRLAALRRLQRSTLALTRTTFVLAFKGLAIMNFS